MKNYECYLGNPIPGDINGDVGSADLWQSNFKIQKQSNKIKGKNKYKNNKRNKMKNLNDKNVLNALIEKYSVDGVLNAIDKLTESLYYNENGYTAAMIQSLMDDGYIEEDATEDDIYEFINDRCMAFWAADEEDLAKQYVDQMINNKDYDTLADFIEQFNCLDYAAIGRDYKIMVDDADDDDEREIDQEFLDMDDYAAGYFVVDNFYSGNLEEMIKHVSQRMHFSSYINFEEAGENMLNKFDYTTGIDEEGNNFYILIFF